MKRMENKVAVVTGAASGIGLAAARGLADEGAAVLLADLDAEAAGTAAEALREEGHRAASTGVDVLSEDSLSRMVDRAVAEFGRLNVLCNNVGGSNPREDLDLLRMSMEEWDRTMDLNVRSTVVASRCAIPHMTAAGGGSIINTASVAGLAGDALQCAYGSSKAAVIRLTQYIATQYGRRGVRCNAVVPGAVMTPALRDNLPADVVEDILNHNALDFIGVPEDIADAMLFLASDESRYLTGQSIVIDGGMSAQSPLATGRRSMLP